MFKKSFNVDIRWFEMVLHVMICFEGGLVWFEEVDLWPGGSFNGPLCVGFYPQK